MKKLSISLFVLALSFWAGACLAAVPGIANLKVEYAVTPIGIDIERPRFSWQMLARGQSKGQRQTAYALVVKDSLGEVVWKTGKVRSDQSLNIDYAGAPLAATRRYDWTVQVWDEHERPRHAASWFETGLGKSDATLVGWSGAKWIRRAPPADPLRAAPSPQGGIRFPQSGFEP